MKKILEDIKINYKDYIDTAKFLSKETIKLLITGSIITIIVTIFVLVSIKAGHLIFSYLF
jgi:hypothetical protein